MTKKQTSSSGTDPNVLKVETSSTDDDAVLADLTVEGLCSNAMLMQSYSKNAVGTVSITHAVKALRATIKDVNRGDLGAAETILFAQASALNTMFFELARRSGANMGEHMSAAEAYMRLALKAQGQCRATLETLAAIKNPPVVFARQANINSGGQQQVNNGHASSVAPTAARLGETTSAPNELLEDQSHGRTQVDSRAKAAAGRANPVLEPVGALNRAPKR